MNGRRQRDLCRGLALGSCTAEQRLRRRDDAGGLCAHPKNATGARGEDLEVEIREVHSELLTGVSESLFHRLSGEFAVCVACGSHG